MSHCYAPVPQGTTGGCVHGRFCGPCNGNGGKDSPMDELDRACFFHDICFYDGGYTTKGSCAECHCNAQLGDVASRVRNGLALHACNTCAPRTRCKQLLLHACYTDPY